MGWIFLGWVLLVLNLATGIVTLATGKGDWWISLIGVGLSVYIIVNETRLRRRRRVREANARLDRLFR